MTVIINTNPNNQRELLMKYSTSLLALEGKCRGKFKDYKSMCKKMSVINQVTSSVAVSSGTAGVVTAVTIVGLPVSVALASISVIGGVISAIVTTIGRSKQKSAIRYQQKISVLSQSRIEINNIISSTYNGTLISDEKVNKAMEIYSEAFKKVHQLHMDDISTINLDVEEGLKAYTDGLDIIKKELANQ